ncbi:MAG: hypothetical protein P4L28_07760 [Paludibacteraceae bacterium]|nr:hypothetical protein [Paludibacteraceae bacterium]
METKKENEIKCPRCGSNQITANKKGFNAGNAIVGDLLLGDIGLLAGTAGKNKVIITCLKCGKQFNPGEDLETKTNQKEMFETKIGKISILICFVLLSLFLIWIGIPFWWALGLSLVGVIGMLLKTYF